MCAFNASKDPLPGYQQSLKSQMSNDDSHFPAAEEAKTSN